MSTTNNSKSIKEVSSPIPKTTPAYLRPSVLLLITASLIGVIGIIFRPTLLRAAATLPSFRRFAVPSTSLRPISTATEPVPVTMATKIYSAYEEKQWNSLAEGMDRFHAHFRYEFNRVYTLADGGFHKEGMSLSRFLREAQQLAHHLDMHHRIEETYIFPKLAKRMPQFAKGGRENGAHLKSHKQIHNGLDRYEAFLKASLENNSSYNPAALREIMDGFREVLYRHLDEEVHDLGAESMKAAGWNLAELREIPM